MGHSLEALQDYDQKTFNPVGRIPFKPGPTPQSSLGGLDPEGKAVGVRDTPSATWKQWLGILSPSLCLSHPQFLLLCPAPTLTAWPL